MHRRLSSNIIIEYWECLCKFKFLRRKFLWMKKRNKVLGYFVTSKRLGKKKKKEENYIFRLAQVKLKCRTLFLYFSSLSLFFSNDWTCGSNATKPHSMVIIMVHRLLARSYLYHNLIDFNERRFLIFILRFLPDYDWSLNYCLWLSPATIPTTVDYLAFISKE